MRIAVSRAPGAERVVTPLELFFDLVYVFAIGQLAHHLVEHVDLRTGAETVVFLYGVGLQQFSTGQFLLILALGLAAAFATFWLLQRGGRALSWRAFFRISEVLLLLLAGGLLVTGLEKLIALGALPPVADQLWNSTALLDDSTRFGGFVAAMTGYRAQPALLPMLALVVFWVTVTLALRAPRGIPKAA